jgi:hypothetical protein
VAVFGLLMLLAVFGFVSAWVLQSAVSNRDVLWLAGAERCSSAERLVYERYLVRHRRHRSLGGLFGVVFAVIVGIRYFQIVSIGIGQSNPLADVLFCGIGGVQVGLLSAETYRLAPTSLPVAAASLAPRDHYRSMLLVWLPRSLTVIALAVGVVNAATTQRFAPLWIAAVGLVFACFAEATQLAITRRRRPLLSGSAQYVDTRLRSFAARSLSLLQTAAAVLVVGWTLSKLSQFDRGVAGFVRTLAVIACLVVAVMLLRRAAPRPPRRYGSVST